MLGVGTLTFTSQSPHRAFIPRAAISELSSPPSLYEVLRVKRNASPVEIKTAYRTLAKLYHPDATSRFMDSSAADGGDFIEIRNAYATLSDPDARAVYDLDLTGQRRRRGGLETARFCQTRRRWETDQCW